MRMLRLLAAVLFLPGLTTACASDWPNYRGPSRDARSQDTGLLKEWPAGGPKLLWSAKDIGGDNSEPIVAGGMIYVLGIFDDPALEVHVKHRDAPASISAFDLKGQLLWKKSCGIQCVPHPDDVPHKRPPLVSDGKLYVLNGHHVLTCLDAKSGEKLWDVELAQRFPAQERQRSTQTRGSMALPSPLADGNLIICTPGGQDAAVVALDKSTGQTVWTSKGLSDSCRKSVPVALQRGQTRLIVVQTDAVVAGLDAADGKVLWTNPLPDPGMGNMATPLYAEGRLYCHGGVILDLSEDGKSVKASQAEAALGGGFCDNLLIDGHVFGMAPGPPNQGKSRSCWTVLNLKTGRVVFQTPFEGASTAWADGLIYANRKDNKVCLIQPSSTELKIVSSFDLRGQNYLKGFPVIAEGMLFIRKGGTREGTLLAYDLRRN